MIKSSRPMRTASLFPSSFFFSLFFLSDDRSCGEAFYSSICSFIHTYIYINIYTERYRIYIYICIFLSIIHFQMTSSFILIFTGMDIGKNGKSQYGLFQYCIHVLFLFFLLTFEMTCIGKI
jgi:hypothetical protein